MSMHQTNLLFFPLPFPHTKKQNVKPVVEVATDVATDVVKDAVTTPEAEVEGDKVAEGKMAEDKAVATMASEVRHVINYIRRI